MDTGNSELAVYAKRTLEVLAEQGIDTAPLLQRAGIAADELRSGSETVDAQKYERLLEEAVALDIPALGLLEGDNVSPLSHGLLGYAMYSSATLGKCIERHSHYQDLLCAVLKTRLFVEGETAWLRVVEYARPRLVDSEAKLRYQSELLFALWAQQGPAMGLSKQWFSELHFSFPAPPHAPRYRDYFGCPVRFNQPLIQAGFDARLLEQPFSFANEEAAALCERRCAAQLQELSEAEGVRGKVLRYLARNPSRSPNIQEVADHLHLGERALRRRLAEEGVTYKELLKGFRLNLAREYLANTNLPLGEVAFLVGYSGVANFHRAFVAEFQVTPGQYRESAVRN